MAWTAAGTSPLDTNWLTRTNGSNHPDDHRRPPLRRGHHRGHRGHRRRGYQNGQRVAGDGDLDDGSRLEDGSVGCAVARHHAEHDAWAGVRVRMGKNQEIFDAKLHAIYCAMLAPFKEPRGQKITIFADAWAALQMIKSDAPGTGHRYTTGTRPTGATKSLRPIQMGPQPCRHRRQRKGRRVGKDGSTE